MTRTDGPCPASAATSSSCAGPTAGPPHVPASTTTRPGRPARTRASSSDRTCDHGPLMREPDGSSDRRSATGTTRRSSAPGAASSVASQSRTPGPDGSGRPSTAGASPQRSTSRRVVASPRPASGERRRDDGDSGASLDRPHGLHSHVPPRARARSRSFTGGKVSAVRRPTNGTDVRARRQRGALPGPTWAERPDRSGSGGQGSRSCDDRPNWVANVFLKGAQWEESCARCCPPPFSWSRS